MQKVFLLQNEPSLNAPSVQITLDPGAIDDDQEGQEDFMTKNFPSSKCLTKNLDEEEKTGEAAGAGNAGLDLN